MTTPESAVIPGSASQPGEQSREIRHAFVPATSLNSSTSSCSSGIDSGYASQRETPTYKSAIQLDLAKAFSKKQRHLHPFYDIAIPEQTYQRFEDLQKEFAKPFYNFLRKSYCNLGHVSTKLIVMGESRESAKPCVVVQCEDRIAAKVKQFFKKKEVKAQYQPPDRNLGFPALEVFVRPQAPSQKAMLVDRDITVEAEASASGHLEYSSGSRIRTFMDDGTERVATLGGFIKLSYGQYGTVYGLTVGHVFFENTATEIALNNDTDQMPSVNETCKDDDDEEGEDDNDCDSDSVILDFGLSDPSDFEERGIPETDFESEIENDGLTANENKKRTEAERPPKADTTSHQKWAKAGRVFGISPPLGSLKLGGDKDWALIKLENGRPSSGTGSWKINPTLVNGLSPNYNPDSFTTALGRRVIMLTNGISSDEGDKDTQASETLSFATMDHLLQKREGRLGTEFSFLMLSLSNDFTKTYNLRFSDRKGLRDGDCGSWVVDAETAELYGHVVASDSLEEAYVVPIQSIFADIRSSFAIPTLRGPTLELAMSFRQSDSAPSHRPLPLHSKRTSKLLPSHFQQLSPLSPLSPFSRRPPPPPEPPAAPSPPTEFYSSLLALTSSHYHTSAYKASAASQWSYGRKDSDRELPDLSDGLTVDSGYGSGVASGHSSIGSSGCSSARSSNASVKEPSIHPTEYHSHIEIRERPRGIQSRHRAREVRQEHLKYEREREKTLYLETHEDPKGRNTLTVNGGRHHISFWTDESDSREERRWDRMQRLRRDYHY